MHETVICICSFVEALYSLKPWILDDFKCHSVFLPQLLQLAYHTVSNVRYTCECIKSSTISEIPRSKCRHVISIVCACIIPVNNYVRSYLAVLILKKDFLMSFSCLCAWICHAHISIRYVLWLTFLDTTQHGSLFHRQV